MTGGPNKRSYGQSDDINVEECVDDMAVAAAYAVATVSLTCNDENTTETKKLDAAEIDLDEEEEEDSTAVDDAEAENAAMADSKSANNPATAPMNDNNKEDPTDAAESDDESDVDLSQAIAALEDGDGDDDGLHAGSTTAVTTKNEIDAYRAPLPSEINSVLTSDWPLQQCRRAGVIQHVLTTDVVVVVIQSEPQHTGGILSEDSHLGVALPANIPNNLVTPLGRILEIFGPIREPLYSLRLAVQKPSKSNASSKTGDETPSSPVEDESTKQDLASALVPGLIVYHNPAANASTADGKHTNINSSTNQPSLVDPQLIWRQSGRGCDASDLHDEEVVQNDYFSDDEQERLAKRQTKALRQRRPGKSRMDPVMPPPPPPTTATTHTTPTGFHVAAVPKAPASSAPPPPDSDTVYYEY